MRFRKLRIAWSVFWGVGCLLFVVLWANSNVVVDRFAIPVTQTTYFRFGFFPNSLGIGVRDEGLSNGTWHQQDSTDDWTSNFLTYYGSPYSSEPSFAKVDGMFVFPFWFAVLVSAALTAAPLIFARGGGYEINPQPAISWGGCMSFRKLRIAWSVFSGLAAVLLIVMWVRSYWWKEQIELSFGHSQVEQFIRDRPGVSGVINRQPALRAKLEAMFEKGSERGRVYWDEREPTDAPAEHIIAYNDYPAMIRVTNRSAYSAVDKCSMLLFELYNIQSDRYFDALTSIIAQDKISRDDYVRSVARGEFTALKKTRDFFHTYPLSDGNNNDHDRYNWLMGVPDDLADYLRTYDRGMDASYLKRLRQDYDRIKSYYSQ